MNVISAFLYQTTHLTPIYTGLNARASLRLYIPYEHHALYQNHDFFPLPESYGPLESIYFSVKILGAALCGDKSCPCHQGHHYKQLQVEFDDRVEHHGIQWWEQLGEYHTRKSPAWRVLTHEDFLKYVRPVQTKLSSDQINPSSSSSSSRVSEEPTEEYEDNDMDFNDLQDFNDVPFSESDESDSTGDDKDNEDDSTDDDEAARRAIGRLFTDFDDDDGDDDDDEDDDEGDNEDQDYARTPGVDSHKFVEGDGSDPEPWDHIPSERLVPLSGIGVLRSVV